MTPLQAPPLKYSNLIEEPREDLIYAVLRRVNAALTCRLGQNTPLGQLIVLIVAAICIVVLVAAISIQTSAIY